MTPNDLVRHHASGAKRHGPATLGVLLLAGAALAENTNSMWKPSQATPGGANPQPIVTSIGTSPSGVTVTWDGLQGPFQLQQTRTLDPTEWLNVGAATFDHSLTFPAADPHGLLRIAGDEPTYVGASLCLLCHRDTHAAWTNTVHASALKTLQDIHQGENASCLPCHTVGYGWENGYLNEQTTARLANVQCENCHGPAVRHVENVDDPVLRPPVTPAAEICGGCHNGFHHPTFDEWKTSPHSRVDAEVASSIVAQGEARMKACGPCHSGAVRLAMLKQLDDPAAPLPSREDAAYFGVTCSVCHDAHSKGEFVAQLRNPAYSTNNFSYSTAATTSFAQQYDPAIQLCGQCHNMRGARWEDTSRPPHHSPQYNLLVGQGGYDLGNTPIATHGLKIEQQCAHCHTHPHEATPPSPDDPNYTGHTFEVRFENCLPCHSASRAETITNNRQQRTLDGIEEVRSLLDRWATNKAPAALMAKYGTLAWEYNNPGALSNPNANPALRGPTTAEQAAVPSAIKQARMNLYLVLHDASLGVHNPRYTPHLLQVAKTNVVTELEQP